MATLKSLVDETSIIKNELIECYTNLKSTLIRKGIDASNLKLSKLIEKTSELVAVEYVSGDSIIMAEINDTEYNSSSSYTKYEEKALLSVSHFNNNE